MITFSIAIPVYNVERYLRSCLDSICRQMADDIEILLVDDGSTDNSGAICDEYKKKDCRIRVFHQSNQGLSAARNVMIRQARGKWIVFVDGDDLLADNALQIMRNFSNGADNLVVFGIQKFYHDFNLKEPISHPDEKCMAGKEITDYRLGILDQEYKNLLFSDMSLRSAPAKMWDLGYIRNNGIQFGEGLKYAEDMVFNFTATRNMKQIRLVYQCIYGYRSNPGSITMRFSGDVASCYNMIMKYLTDDMERHSELQSKAMQNAFWKNAAYYFENTLIIGVQHPDCQWNHAQRIKWLKALCSEDWVKGAAEYAKKTNMLTTPLRLAMNREYEGLDHYCRKKRVRYRIVRRLNESIRGQKFVSWYSERKNRT